MGLLKAAGAVTAYLVGCETTKSASCEGRPRAAPPQISMVQPSPVTPYDSVMKVMLQACPCQVDTFTLGTGAGSKGIGSRSASRPQSILIPEQSVRCVTIIKVSCLAQPGCMRALMVAPLSICVLLVIHPLADAAHFMPSALLVHA